MIVLLLDRPFKSFLHDGALVAVGVLSAAVDAREAVARRPREGPLPPRVPQRLLLALLVRQRRHVLLPDLPAALLHDQVKGSLVGLKRKFKIVIDPFNSFKLRKNAHLKNEIWDVYSGPGGGFTQSSLQLLAEYCTDLTECD